MNRAPRHTTVRSAAALSALALALPLSGCLASMIPDERPAPAPTPAESTPPSPPETDQPDAGGAPDRLTFEAGADLSPNTVVQWGDGLMLDEGWEVVSPDDGNGGWTYGTVDGVCTAQFWQGTVFALQGEDDRAASDFMLASILGAEVSQLEGHAADGEFSYLSPGNAGVDHRYVVAADGDRSWRASVRAFTATKAALYVIVDCASPDSSTVVDEVLLKMSVLVMP